MVVRINLYLSENKYFFLCAGSSYPCGGVLMALRGDDGRELWRAATRSVVVHHVCGGVDVNGDGRGDCIVTGRHSTCQAVDVVTGLNFFDIFISNHHIFLLLFLIINPYQ